MASISPFLILQIKYHFMRVQISGHSSVKSSSTFRSRKTDKPIYILRFKKIEQGQLLYPKICPPIFLNTWQVRSPNFSRKFKSWPDKLSSKATYLKLGFLVSSRCVGNPKVPNAFHGPNIFSRSSMSSFMPFTRSLLNQLLRCLKINSTRSKVKIGRASCRERV